MRRRRAGPTSTTPPPLTESRPDLPPGLDTVFATSLAKSPDDRRATCLALVAALRLAATGADPGGHPPTQVAVKAAEFARKTPRRPPPWAQPVFRGG
ncbi:hypothetical protein OG866_04405 [Streptomyces sp. NBC_00663]|uniref:hypothetical protein n=1 Tax=Streptomyces sp. NBC_00663 TaxID=2975801 RepID=UPI002E33E988|nr:hypothetical protein [Streptomyces sp. NBC_00663]